MREYFPDELNIESALWTRATVQTLIAYECGVEMPIHTVGEYLKRWGYMPQKSLHSAYEQDPQAVKVWLETQFQPSSNEHGRRMLKLLGETSQGCALMLKLVALTHRWGRPPKINWAVQEGVYTTLPASATRQGTLHAQYPETNSTSVDRFHGTTNC
jgi:hypothetical protein